MPRHVPPLYTGFVRRAARTRASSLGIINKNDRISAALTEPRGGQRHRAHRDELTQRCPTRYSQPRPAAVEPSSAIAPLDKICDLNKFPHGSVPAPHQPKIVLYLTAQNVPRRSPAAALLCWRPAGVLRRRSVSTGTQRVFWWRWGEQNAGGAPSGLLITGTHEPVREQLGRAEGSLLLSGTRLCRGRSQEPASNQACGRRGAGTPRP